MKGIITSVVLLFVALAFGQNSEKSSIAVAKPFVNNLGSFDDVTASKLIQLELIKMDIYSVYDEFDMAEVLKDSSLFMSDCYGINCLTLMGQKLNADYIVSGRFDGLSGKIAISLKVIDVKKGSLHKSIVREFDNQPEELQRMVEILLKELHSIEPDKTLVDRLKFNNELITSNNVGKINNSGPRVGYAYLVGTMNEFANRPQVQGGLDIFPGVSMIGYQIEGQYVGTENFSALVEGVFNISGLEQGVFIPSITLLNGFRFGKAGWELAFGPGFSIRRTSNGFFDTQNIFGKGDNYYFSENDWNTYASENYGGDSTYYDPFSGFIMPSPQEVSGDDSYAFSSNLDKRGSFKFATNWVFAFGRTFKAGALNIPVNVFYSSTRGGGMAGVSVGFNVQKSKDPINRYQ